MFNGIEEVIVCLKIKQSGNTRQWVSETTDTGDSFEGSLSDSETSESQPEVEVLPEHVNNFSFVNQNIKRSALHFGPRNTTGFGVWFEH